MVSLEWFLNIWNGFFQPILLFSFLFFRFGWHILCLLFFVLLHRFKLSKEWYDSQLDTPRISINHFEEVGVLFVILISVIPKATFLTFWVYLFGLKEEAFLFNLYWNNWDCTVNVVKTVYFQECSKLRFIVDDIDAFILNFELSLLTWDRDVWYWDIVWDSSSHRVYVFVAKIYHMYSFWRTLNIGFYYHVWLVNRAFYVKKKYSLIWIACTLN